MNIAYFIFFLLGLITGEALVMLLIYRHIDNKKNLKNKEQNKDDHNS